MPNEHATDDADTGLSAFDDIGAHSKVMKESMIRANEVLAMGKFGMTKETKKKLRQEVPELNNRLRQLLVAQFQKKGAIRQMDLSDGSYDNVFIDDALRKQIAALRNFHIRHNTMLGTRTIRKLSGLFREDISNFFTVKWRQAKDNLWQYSKATMVVGGMTTVGLVGGYSAALGFGPGMSMLGSHLGTVLSYLGSGTAQAGSLLSTGTSKVTGGISTIFGKISTLFGG